MTDIVEDLRAQCLASHEMPARPDGPTHRPLSPQLRRRRNDPEALMTRKGRSEAAILVVALVVQPLGCREAGVSRVQEWNNAFAALRGAGGLRLGGEARNRPGRSPWSISPHIRRKSTTPADLASLNAAVDLHPRTTARGGRPGPAPAHAAAQCRS